MKRSLEMELVKKWRRDTPACEHKIHLNNAGTALSPAPVVKVVEDYLRLEQEIGGYEAELERSAQLEAVYTSLARLVGGKPQEIAITQNATRAWDLVFYALPLKREDKILTCRAEYASNYIAFLQRQKQIGFEIVVLENDESGAVCPESLKNNLDDTVKLLAINHIPTNGGLIQPAEELGRIVKDHPAFYLLDACQSVGQVPLDVNELHCDALTATSRKYLRGPRGLGFLHISAEQCDRLEPPFLDLHAATWTSSQDYTLRADAKRFETYELFLAGKLGLGAAAEYALAQDIEVTSKRLATLAARAREGLKKIDGIQVHDLGQNQGGIVTFSVPGYSPTEVRERLSSANINVWTCTVRSARLDMEARALDEVVRASFHYYNSEQETDDFLAAVGEL